MKRLLFVIALGLAAPSAAADLALVNETGEPIVEIVVRPTPHGDWLPVGSTLANGARQKISVDTEPQCSFDVRARLASGKELVYSGVNLCETSAVTLNRRADGTSWVDYD